MTGLSQAANQVEALGIWQQFGVAAPILLLFTTAIGYLFRLMLKSKDAEIAAAAERLKAAEDQAEERVKAADERASRFETKLDHLQDRIQGEILTVLKDASNTTRHALEITRGGHDSR